MSSNKQLGIRNKVQSCLGINLMVTIVVACKVWKTKSLFLSSLLWNWMLVFTCPKVQEILYSTYSTKSATGPI